MYSKLLIKTSKLYIPVLSSSKSYPGCKLNGVFEYDFEIAYKGSIKINVPSHDSLRQV